MVNYNFEQCVKHLTVPLDELTNEIQLLIRNERKNIPNI